MVIENVSGKGYCEYMQDEFFGPLGLSEITAGKVQEYMSYTLENCLVSGFILSAGAEGEPVENIALSFSKVMISYSDFDAKNKASNPQRVGYDLAVAKPL